MKLALNANAKLRWRSGANDADGIVAGYRQVSRRVRLLRASLECDVPRRGEGEQRAQHTDRGLRASAKRSS